jgi:rhodanese-related sulfurtransferase
MSTIREVSPTAALALIKKGALLVDVREPSEVARKAFDVPEVMLIPLREIEKRIKEIPANRKVIVACNSGSRSSMAMRTLMKHGYGKAVNMQYGISGWTREGLPVKGKPKQSFGSWLMGLFGKKS